MSTVHTTTDDRSAETPTPTTFSTDPSGLDDSRGPTIVELADGDTFDLCVAAVAKNLGADRVRMLAYNGSIPGPTLRVRQGSEITVRVRNEADVDTTVHWHGLRLDNAYDGVACDTQEAIRVGGDFTYKVRFPDPGLYWYHPHIREDYALDMGLYGNLVVDPADGDYWPPVNRDQVVTLDDVLVEDGRIAPFNHDGPTHVAMGRYGNVMLTGGETDLALRADAGEVVRFLFTNTANTRLFNVAVPGVLMKLVGGDSGRYEHETFVDSVLLAPSERAIVDVRFDAPGSFPLQHRTPEHTYTLGTITVGDGPVDPSPSLRFETLRSNRDMVNERRRCEADRERPPDKTLAFESVMSVLSTDPETASVWACPMHPDVVSDRPGTCPRCGMKLLPAPTDTAPADPNRHSHGSHPHGDHPEGHDTTDGLEWEDLMPAINRASDSRNMAWKLVDRDTGHGNGQIGWAFRVGDRVKIRLENAMAQDHPMHHPFHIHGAGRFLVLSRNDKPDENLVWKDTVLVHAGETVDILLDVTNRGIWMAHCHIAEHNQAGMMFSFSVTEAAGR